MSPNRFSLIAATRLNTSACLRLPFLPDRFGDVLGINREPGCVGYQMTVAHYELGHDRSRLGWRQLAPPDLAILKTPIHLIPGLESSRLGHIFRERGLPF